MVHLVDVQHSRDFLIAYCLIIHRMPHQGHVKLSIDHVTIHLQTILRLNLYQPQSDLQRQMHSVIRTLILRNSPYCIYFPVVISYELVRVHNFSGLLVASEPIVTCLVRLFDDDQIRYRHFRFFVDNLNIHLNITVFVQYVNLVDRHQHRRVRKLHCHCPIPSHHR